MLFSLFSDPFTPALVSAIAAHRFGINFNWFVSFLFEPDVPLYFCPFSGSFL